MNIDARGLACPKPVIETKKAIEIINNGKVKVIVDNYIAKENIIKLSRSMNLEFNILKDEDSFIEIEIIKGEFLENITEEKSNDIENSCVFISSDKIGEGDIELGKILMKGFVYTLTETKPYPKYIILVNSGVNLSTGNEDTIENLKKLENFGVEIVSCGTCLDFYNLKESLKVGRVSNMYDILEIMKIQIKQYLYKERIDFYVYNII